MIKTPYDLLSQTLKRCGILGVGQTPEAEDMNDAFDALNGLIAQWSAKRWLVWALDDIACTSTGAQTYTIGAGEQFNTPRPDRLEFAYVRLLPNQGQQTLDTPLYIMQSREEYSSIVLKQLSTWPTSIWYDTQFPVGFIRPWPVPTANMYEIHVGVKNQITPFTALNEVITSQVPPVYFEALSWNLAARLRPAYGLPPDPQVVNLALNSLNAIRQTNVQMPILSMPYGYPSKSAHGYGFTIGISGGFA